MPAGQVPGLPDYALVGHKKSVVREYGEAFAIAIALALVIRTFLVQAYKIPSGSMEPTLLIGDHILVNKLIFGLRMPDSLFGVRRYRELSHTGSMCFASNRSIGATSSCSSFRPIRPRISSNG